MEVAEQQTGVPDGWAIVAPGAPPPSVTPKPDVSAHAGVPARGRGTQLDPDKSMRGLEAATTPLARPTGIDAIDGLTSPVGLASLAAGGVGIARAGIEGGVSAGARAAAAQATPQIKYELTKSALKAVGIPEPMAMAAAMFVSGYKKGVKAEPISAPSNVAPSGVETAQEALARRMASAPVAAPSPAVPVEPVAVGPAAPAVPAAPVTPAAAPPQPAASAPSPVAAPQASPLPDQKSLNEAALAVRRAAYQARMSSAPPVEAAPAPVAGNVKLTAAETKAFLNLMQRGMPGPEAMKNVLMQRSLVESLGTPTPTAAETRFPKGMRGKSTP